VKLARLVVVLLTVIASFFAARLELSKDLTTLFPHTPEADALARVTRAFGGGDVALVLVRGEDPAAVERATEAVASELRASPSVAAVVTSAPAPRAMDPTEAWRFAGPVARERLARAVTEEGMRERLRETRALLLAPGASEAAELVARDPLRLSLIPWQDRIEVAAAVRGAAGGAFVADEGRARLVAIEPRGRAFEAGDAARFTAEGEAALDRVRARPEHAGVTFELTGGHVIAQQTEAMIRSDLEKSSALSMLLASVAFLLTFRRVRALVAVLPPLAMGTAWTAALAAMAYPRLSAVATAFAAVVVGVGVDTGVHVYGRLLEARRAGLPPERAADLARRQTWRPTIGAALAAAGAFGCLALSYVEGMRQLGVLCAAGEILTAVAILIVVPELGAMLERGRPPAPARGLWIAALTRTRTRAAIALAAMALAVGAGIAAGAPRLDHAVAALDARALPAVKTYDAIYSMFDGVRGQLVVVSHARGGTPEEEEERARARADAVAETAERLLAGGSVAGFDALARLAPSAALQKARLEERDKLDLPSRKPILERVLVEEGFSLDAFGSALEAFEHPSSRTDDVLASGEPAFAWLRRRHLAHDDEGAIAVTYVRVSEGADDTARVLLRAADPEAVITGYAELERSLERTLASDLPRVLLGALGVVVFVLGASLRRPSRVALAVVVLFVEIAIVLALSRLLHVRWHVYDALVLPVLLGITLDEVLFLLEAAERRASIDEAIAEQAPLGTATALTTAGGFGALVICRFDGLVDMGKVGALGSLVGVVVALVIIPAAYRLLGPAGRSRAMHRGR
jgi:predicted RND superfamily exporter protein